MDHRRDVAGIRLIGRPSGAAHRYVWLAAFDPDGEPRWTQTYNSPGDGFDTIRELAVLDDGEIVAVGVESRPDLGQSSDILVRRHHADGGLAWTLRVDGPGHGADEARGAAATDDGDVVVVGNIVEGPTVRSSVLWISLLAPNGAAWWTRTYAEETDGYAEGRGVAVGPDGGVIAIGQLMREDLEIAVVLHYGPDGTLRWTRTRGREGYGTTPHDVVVDPNGDIVVVGEETAYEMYDDPSEAFIWRLAP